MRKIFRNDWAELLDDELNEPYYQELRKFLIDEYSTKLIFPNMYDIFNALHFTSYESTKVVILGQDPYHEPGQAHGLSFSVLPNVPTPPSLANIFKELQDDLGCFIPNNGCLKPWAEQGVLLLNSVLTVRAHAANSHRGHGWEIFTDTVIRRLNEREQPTVFLLWGANARSKKSLITNQQHLILEAAHPSPLSAWNGFFGCRHFSRTNDFLQSQGIEPIDWQI